MKSKDVKTLLAYYREIPSMIRLLREEEQEIEDIYYDTVGSANLSGIISGDKGNPVEKNAIRAIEANAKHRQETIEVKICVLQGDREKIENCVDVLCGEYKTLLIMRHMYKYSWAKISAHLGIPDSTARNRYDKAIKTLGIALDEEPMIEEILFRASRARV